MMRIREKERERERQRDRKEERERERREDATFTECLSLAAFYWACTDLQLEVFHT